jgi:peptide/nickel transport system substrate-binding protein
MSGNVHRRNFLKGAGAVTLGAQFLPFLKSMPAHAAKADTAVVVIG